MESLKDTLKQMWNSINTKNDKLKVQRQTKLDWTIIKQNVDIKEFEKMYNGYHVRYKFRFLKPLLLFGIYIAGKLNKKVLGKSFIKPETIEKEKYNKVINVWNDTINETCKDSMLILKKDLKGYNDPDSVYWNRFVKLLNSLLINNVVYDTFYRGLFEIFVIKLAINMGEAFKDDKSHVLYNKKRLDDIDFWMATHRNNSEHIVLPLDDGLLVAPRGSVIKLMKQNPEESLKEAEKRAGVNQPEQDNKPDNETSTSNETVQL